MVNMFEMLAKLQSLGYRECYCEMKGYHEQARETSQEILDLQKKIIETINELNGQKVY